MSLCGHAQAQDESDVAPVTPIAIFQDTYSSNSPAPLIPAEQIVTLRNYRSINENIREYTSTSDNHTSPTDGKLLSRLDMLSAISPPRSKILELLRPDDPGKDTLEAIVRPTPRRGLVRPYDEDTRRFLRRALLASAPNGFPQASDAASRLTITLEDSEEELEKRKSDLSDSNKERSLADELREAEEEERTGENLRRELLREFRKRGGGIKEAMERDRLGKLALSVEEDAEYEDCGMSAAARRLDALLVESRSLHEELAGIHDDIQVESARASRCSAAARALTTESQALRFLDDVVALLRGDVVAARLTRRWPFAFGRRQPDKNYIV